jgi:eukaryotic-like serine/threonine-protein kinase
MPSTLEQQAQAIVDQLLKLPPAEQFIAAERACAGDAQLLDRVRALLSAQPTMSGFVSDVTVDAATIAESQAPVTEQVGTLIGRYKLLEKIGEGGFGIVFKAQQEKPVRRWVALKIIKLGMDTREVVARFEAERQALALMDHRC